MWKRISLLGCAVLLAAIGFAVQLPVARADGAATWNAEFYNNTTFTGPIAFARQDTLIAFNWGNASPDPSVNVDSFTARWRADNYFFATGTYRFTALADDFVRVYVGGQLVIDTFENTVGQTFARDVAISEGNYSIIVEYQENGGQAYVFVAWNSINASAATPLPTTNPLPNQPTGVWLAQYYANATLSGLPALIQSEGSPNHDWGNGSPSSNIPSDFFSARWTSTLTVEAGSYQINAQVDDGVRVIVDGKTIIDEFHTSAPTIYTATVNLTAGAHVFVVEYLEETLLANITVNVTRLGDTINPPAATNATLSIGRFRVNLRNAPNTVNSSILAKLNPGESYSIVGRNADGTWWQINAGGIVGWVFGSLVTVQNTGNVPITTGQVTTVQGTGFTITASADVNIREEPTIRAGIHTTLPIGAQAELIGRNTLGTWLQIRYNGVVGWVLASLVRPFGVTVSQLPITG